MFLFLDCETNISINQMNRYSDPVSKIRSVSLSHVLLPRITTLTHLLSCITHKLTSPHQVLLPSPLRMNGSDRQKELAHVRQSRLSSLWPPHANCNPFNIS